MDGYKRMVMMIAISIDFKIGFFKRDDGTITLDLKGRPKKSAQNRTRWNLLVVSDEGRCPGCDKRI